MATVVDALIVTLGLDTGKFDKGAKSTNSELTKMAKKVLGVVGAVKLFQNSVGAYVKAGIDVGKFATMNSMAVDEVQSLDNAIKATDGNVGAMRGTIANLSKQMKGLYPVNPFAVIGVQATDANNKIKPMTAILAEVAGKMEGMSGAKQADIGKRLGLDESTIFLLQKGRASVEELFASQKKLGALTKDDTKVAMAYKQAMNEMGIAIGASSASIMKVIVPALTFMADKLTKITIWMRQNDVFVKAFFIGLATIITGMVLPALASMAVAWVAATWPLILLGAAIAAVSGFIALLVDDFMVWKEGGESAFGAVWAKADESFKAIKAIILDFWSTIKDVFGMIGGAASSSLDSMTVKWQEWSDKIKKIVLFITGFAKEKFDALKDKLSFVTKLFGKDEEGESDVSKGFSPAKENGGASEAVKPSAVGGNTQTSTSTSDIKIGTIAVQTQATDAAGIASDMGDAIRDNGLIVNQAEAGLF